MANIEEKIKQELEKIRPSLQADGGDLEYISFNQEKGLVKIELIGQCLGCPMAGLTLKHGIEEELKQAIPEVKEVVAK